jgi:truncated hemoglobin YjbI
MPSRVTTIRARTIASLWREDYEAFYRTGQITERMIYRATRDLQRLEAATAAARETDQQTRGVTGVPAAGWAAQEPLRRLEKYLREQGTQPAVPGWDQRFPIKLVFLREVTTPPDLDMPPQAILDIVPPDEVVERIGATRAVELVHTFYDLMLDQPELVVYFDGTRTGGVPIDLNSLRDHFLQFVVAAFTGMDTYRDRPLHQALEEAHQRLRISFEHWQLTVSIFVTAMHFVEVDAPTIKAVVVGIAAFESAVVFQGGA